MHVRGARCTGSAAGVHGRRARARAGARTCRRARGVHGVRGLARSRFEERTRSHGKIVLWAPQNRVLWHRSVGAHVTHGGYNSVFECVAGEVPMICRPLWGDNKINGVVLEEWGIAVTIDGGTITKDGMLKCLEMVMEGGEVGKTMRQKIRDLKVLVMDAAGPNGSASRYFNKLVDIISS
ncbi:hypothetical protein CRG98_018347 [Punica granatum]|uniref:UDP-glycosyltransferases domain-containing protein n=1 Tax=Punica granatum TaxID=22663 RepID=A0A2I0JZM4_PUNGR|nr:hypothetical protein CRG98_018347 [Punica granatum]